MKTLYEGCICVLGAVMIAALAAHAAGSCPWVTCGMILLGCSSALAFTMHELAALRRYERVRAERARRSAYKAELFREIERID